MADALLTFKDRHTITTLIHTTVKGALDRAASEAPDIMQRAAKEIRDVVENALKAIIPPAPLAQPSPFPQIQYVAPAQVPSRAPTPAAQALNTRMVSASAATANASSVSAVPEVVRTTPVSIDRTPAQDPGRWVNGSPEYPSASIAPNVPSYNPVGYPGRDISHRRTTSTTSTPQQFTVPAPVTNAFPPARDNGWNRRPSNSACHAPSRPVSSATTMQRLPSTPMPASNSQGRDPLGGSFAGDHPPVKQEIASPTISSVSGPPRYDSAVLREQSTSRPALANGQLVLAKLPANGHDPPLKALLSISNENWACIFQYLAPRAERFPNRRPKFTDLIRASHVCIRWRRIILSTSSFWSTLRALSVDELEHLDLLVGRAATYPLDVDIDFMSTGRLDFKKLCSTLVRHMSHIAKLSLRLRSDRMAAWYALTPVFGTRAPMLESLCISFPGSGVVLPIMLFNMHAPRLFAVSAHMQLLPAGCPAFSQVMHFTALDDERNALEEETRRLMDICPQLNSLTLNTPLMDAPLNDGHKGSRQYFRSLEEHYGGKRLLKQLQVTDSGERPSPPRSNMDREPYNVPHKIRLVVPTLQLFQHIDIPTVHIVSACSDTFKFINRRMGPVKHVSFVPDISDAQMVLIDRSNRARVFSRASPNFLYTALRRTDIFRELQSLAVGDYGTTQDWADLFTTPVPTLSSLAIIVSPPRRTPPSVIHIFEASNAHRWACTGLKTLRFCTKEPMIDLGPPNSSPLTVSAAGILNILRRGLLLGTPKLPEVVLDGVVFSEGGGGRDVSDLKSAVGSLILRR